MKLVLHVDGRVDAGGMALVLHNERLADPLDTITRHLATLTGKRKKTEADHAEIARIEWYGGLYMSEDIEAEGGKLIVPRRAYPALPSWNVLRCLQEGAKRHRRGPDVLRGVQPLTDRVRLEYSGPTNPAQMWKEGVFALRKGVGIQGKRTMRTRPIFTEWQLHLEVEVDPVVFDVDTLRKLWAEAGRYCGLGEMRPVYGRFHGTISTNGGAS